MSGIELEVVLAGNEGVGKTSLWTRYLENKFLEDSKKTLSTDLPVGNKTVEINGTKVHLKLLDSGGREALRMYTTSYFKNRDGVLFVFDLTDSETLLNDQASV